MEENPSIHESPDYFNEASQDDQENAIMEETLQLIESSRKLNNIINKISQFMIKVRLSKSFDLKQFKIISSISPQEWIRSQKELLKRICSNKKLHEKYFVFFLQNHTKIAHWYQLAVREKGDIEPYVFKELFLQRRQEAIIQESFNNEKLKESLLHRRQCGEKTQNNNLSNFMIRGNHQSNTRESFTSEKSSNNEVSDNNFESENVSFMKPTFTPYGLIKHKAKSKQFKSSLQQINKSSNSLTQQKQQLMGVFFNNMIQMNELQHKRKPLNLKLYKLKKKQTIDSHDLYMKTFDACNGRRYIFYDYEKHMKGLRERNKYNFFLRNGMMEASMENYLNEHAHPSTPQHSKTISRFQEFQQFKTSQQARQKCSLLPINLLLNQTQLNNYQGLKKVVCDNKSSKVVFVNHQGKPITYYIKQEQKMGGEVSRTCKNTKRANTIGLRKSEVEDGDGNEKVMQVANSKTLR